MPIRHKYMDNI